jgi:Ras-related protein Rab-1A
MLDIDKYYWFNFRFAKENVMRILVGNKCDLDHKRQVSFEQGKELARQYNIKFLETSAKETVNIDELFVSTTKTFLEKQGTPVGVKGNAPSGSSTVSLLNDNNSRQQNDTCC